MAFVTQTEVTIGSYTFKNGVQSIDLSSSWRQIGDTCTILLPNLRGNLERQRIKVGSRVRVVVWTNHTARRTLFTGYVRQINPNVPLEVICEDEFWLLRQTGYVVDKRNVRLKEVLTDVVAKTGIKLRSDIPDIFFERLFLDRTAADLLEAFAEKGLTCYFRRGELFVGLRFAETGLGRVVADTATNVFATSLEYRDEAESLKYRAKVIGYGDDGNKVELAHPVGPAGGKLITLSYTGVTDGKVLEKLARDELATMSYTGYEGSIEVPGWLVAEHGWECDFRDAYYPERKGLYRIDEVTHSIGDGRWRQSWRLGIRVS